MDLNGIDGLNEIRPIVYRAALKLRSLQKLCQMHLVSLRDLGPILCAVWGSGDSTVNLTLDTLRQGLEQLFQTVSKELPGQVVSQAIEQTTRLLFKLYDREETGFVLLRSVEAALVVLSGDTLSGKHRALFQLAVTCSGRRGPGNSHISYNDLRVLLDDLCKIPAVVQESHVFGHVETAVRSCFSGVISGSVGEEHFVSWLQSEPRLLLWLSTLYRLSVSEDVHHRVRCHACKSFPITGLRYRCLKCLNVHLCQNCFLTERRTRKHKPSHPVLEYCTEPSWKESMASLASSARHVLRPRRSTRNEAEMRRAERVASVGEQQDSFPIPVLQQPQQYNNANEDLDARVSATTLSPSSPSPLVKVESKALQTDNPDTQPRRSASLLEKDLSTTQKAMIDLQRDKWLLEREFQVWKVAAQTEHDSLEERCTELEATMEAISHHNQQLEAELEEVRNALSMRGKQELDIEIQQSLSTPPPLPPQQHTEDDMSEKQWTPSESPDSDSIPTAHEESAPEKDEDEETKEWIGREEEDDTHHQTEEEDLVVTDTRVTETNVEDHHVGVSEGQRDEEEKVEPEVDGHEFIIEDPPTDGSVQEEDYDTDISDEEEEKELLELVKTLQNDLLVTTATESGPPHNGPLLQAAEKVGDAIFQVVICFEPSSSEDELSLTQLEEENL